MNCPEDCVLRMPEKCIYRSTPSADAEGGWIAKEKAWSCTDRLWCDNQYLGSQSVWLLDNVVAVGRLSPQLSGRGPCTQPEMKIGYLQSGGKESKCLRFRL